LSGGLWSGLSRSGWQSYGDDKEALVEPLRAFSSWFLRITCDRCGKDRMLNEAHTPHRDLRIWL
jgi:hypothetical protein